MGVFDWKVSNLFVLEKMEIIFPNQIFVIF